MSQIRLILKIPHTTQTGHESWTDTTYYTSVDFDVPDEVAQKLVDHATIIGGHRIEDPVQCPECGGMGHPAAECDNMG